MSNLEAETKPVVISKTATTSAAQTLLNKSETATLMVLSSTGNTNVNGNVIVTAAPGSNPTTVTVRSAGNALPGTKTIVVMPVSNAVGSGDAQNAKRLKVE